MKVDIATRCLVEKATLPLVVGGPRRQYPRCKFRAEQSTLRTASLYPHQQLRAIINLKGHC